MKYQTRAKIMINHELKVACISLPELGTHNSAPAFHLFLTHSILNGHQRRGKHFGSSEIIQILAIRNRFRMDLSCIQKFSAEINKIASYIQDKIVRKNSDLRLFLPKKGPKEQEKEETSNKDVNLLLLCPLNQFINHSIELLLRPASLFT